MTFVPASISCDTCGEIVAVEMQQNWVHVVHSAVTSEDYCSWRCLAVRCEKSLLPRQPLPYTTIGVVKRRTALEEELLKKMTE